MTKSMSEPSTRIGDMNTYNSLLSALKEGVDPSKVDLEILITPDEFLKSLIKSDLDVLLPRILRLSISSSDEELRSQSRKCFASLKEAFTEIEFANKEWWNEFQASYFHRDNKDDKSLFLQQMSNLIQINDLGWKECWSFVAVLVFNSNSNKMKSIQSLLKVAEYAFKVKSSDNIDLAFSCWLELIDLFSKNENLSLLQPLKLISLLLTPLKTSTHPKNKLIKIKGFMMILEKIASKYPEHCNGVVKALLTIMFHKEDSSLAIFHPNECLDTLITLTSNETVKNTSFAEIIAVLFKCSEFNIDGSKYIQLVDNVVEHVVDTQNYEEELTQLLQKLCENKKFVLSEGLIDKMRFLPQNLANDMMDNIVTNIKPGLKERTETVEDEESVSPVLSPLASGSVFMHRLAKSNEKKAKSCFALFNDASTSKSASTEISPQKSGTSMSRHDEEIEEPSSVNKSINSTCDDINVSHGSDCSEIIQVPQIHIQNTDISEDTKSFVTEDDLCVSGCADDVTIEDTRLDDTVEDEKMIVESSFKAQECIREKRNRDEEETPERQVKKPCLDNSPVKKKITNYFTTEIPKSFSFGSVTITKVNTSENADNKENSEPNVMPMDEQNDTEPMLETSTADEMDETQNAEEKSSLLTVNSWTPQLSSRAASILRLSQYKSPQVARRSSIKKPSQNNWPSGSQENWIAHGPSGSTPRKSSIKSSEFSSPISKNKRVSFNDPPVTKGLLYDPATNFGQIRHSDSNVTSEDTRIEQYRDSTSSDDSVKQYRNSSSSDDSVNQYRNSTSSDDSVIVHACSEIEASTQNVMPVLQDMSTQCDIPVAVDKSTQLNEGSENAKHASTQTSINIVSPQTNQGSISTENIDFLSVIREMLRNCELRLVYKNES